MNNAERQAPDIERAEEAEDIRRAMPSPLRRHAPLLGVLLAAVVLGPAMSRFLESYRGVVLELRDDSMLIGQDARPPRWVDATDAQAGSIVEKGLGSWSPAVAAAEPRDYKIRQMYTRYVDTYEGTITAINAPVSPGQAATAVVLLEGTTRRVHVPLWADHLAGAAVGRRVRKVSGTWDPELLVGANDTVGLEQPVRPGQPVVP